MSGICRAGSTARSMARWLFQAPPHRSFGAASVQVEYESDWEEYGGDRRSAAAETERWGEVEGRGVQWVFMGSPGAEKHVYATRISKLLEVPYISMGSLVRQELHPRSALYKQIANAVNEGKLVPEDVIFGLLSKRLEEGYHRGETGFVLDGIPRTRVQAEILDQIADIDLVVNLKCMEDCPVKKHFGSDICSHCKRSFNASHSESTSLNPCLATRTEHSQFNSTAAIHMERNYMEKLRIYDEQIKLLEEYYGKQNKLLDFKVADGPRETWQRLLAALHIQHIDAVNSQKLTV